jgi:hypothetical protein
VWIAEATLGSRFPIWPAFLLGTVSIASLYMCFAVLHDWWPTNRRNRLDFLSPDEFPRTEPLGVGLAELIPSMPSRPEPAGHLELDLLDEDWDLWQGCAWIAAIKVRITNTTGQVIRLAAFDLESDPGTAERPKLTQEQVNALFHELMRRRDAYGSAHLHRTDLQPGDSTSGWFVHEAYLPFPARAGRPRCAFKVTDGVGDIYELEIPAREPQLRRMEPQDDLFR